MSTIVWTDRSCYTVSTISVFFRLHRPLRQVEPLLSLGLQEILAAAVLILPENFLENSFTD